jgi:hypothetical protein
MFNAQADDYKHLISPKVENMPKKITRVPQLFNRAAGKWGGRF